MLVRGPESLASGSTVHVSLHLSPDMKPIVGFGSVVRVLSDHKMGIQLNQITIAESARLQEFLLPLIFREGQRELLANVPQIA
jgi:hypothetical protein